MSSPTLLSSRTQFYNSLDQSPQISWKWRGSAQNKPVKCITHFILDDLSKSTALVQDPYWEKNHNKDLKYIKASLDFSEFSFLTKEKLILLLREANLFNLNVSITADKTGYRVTLVHAEFVDFNNQNELLKILKSENAPEWIKCFPNVMFEAFIHSDYIRKRPDENFDVLSLYELADLLEFFSFEKIKQFSNVFVKKLTQSYFEKNLNYCEVVEKICAKLKDSNQIDVQNQSALWHSRLNQKISTEQDKEMFIYNFEKNQRRIDLEDVLKMAELFLNRMEDNSIELENKAYIFSALNHIIEIIMTFEEESKIKNRAKAKFSEVVKSEQWKRWQCVFFEIKEIRSKIDQNIPNLLLHKALKNCAPSLWKLKRILREDLKAAQMSHPLLNVELSAEDRHKIENFIANGSYSDRLCLESNYSLTFPLMNFALEKLKAYHEEDHLESEKPPVKSEQPLVIFVKKSTDLKPFESIQAALERYLIDSEMTVGDLKHKKFLWILDCPKDVEPFKLPHWPNSKFIITQEKKIQSPSRSNPINLNVSITAEFVDFNNPTELQNILRRENIPTWIKRFPEDMCREFLYSNEKSENFNILSLNELAEMLEFLPINFHDFFLKKLTEFYFEQSVNYCAAVEKICSKLKELNQRDLSNRAALRLKFPELDESNFILYFEKRRKIHFELVLKTAQLLLEKLETEDVDLDNKVIIFSALNHLIEIMMTFEEKSEVKESAKIKFSDLLKSKKWQRWQTDFEDKKNQSAILQKVSDLLFQKALKNAPIKWKLERILREDLKAEQLLHPLSNTELSSRDRFAIENFIIDETPYHNHLGLNSNESLTLPLMKYTLEKLKEFDPKSKKPLVIFVKIPLDSEPSQAIKQAMERYHINYDENNNKTEYERVLWIIDKPKDTNFKKTFWPSKFVTSSLN